MRSLSFSVWLLASVVTVASAQDAATDPTSSSSWRIIGAAPALRSSGWVLPAGTQAIRRFDSVESAAGITVRMQLEPVFSGPSVECSTVELGPVALVFQCVGANAQIVVTRSGKIVETVAVGDTLNADGRLPAALAVQLSYTPRQGCVQIRAGETALSVSLAPEDEPHEFALSTGSPVGLPVSELTIAFGSGSARVESVSASTLVGTDTAALAEARTAPAQTAANAETSSSKTTTPDTVTTIGTSPEASGTSVWMPEDAVIDQRLIWTATRQAAAGQLHDAWRTIAVPNTGPARIGFRAMSVAGFLRNMGRLAEAEGFARLAVDDEGTSPTKAQAAAERGTARYWRASLAADILNDPAQALRLSQGGEGETEDARIAPLRARLQRRAETEKGK